jgi:hypothetical protein
MTRYLTLFCGLAAAATAATGTDDWLDRVDDGLTWSAAQDQVRARVSGTFDLEGYRFGNPAPGLIRADGGSLVSPRLTLFLDAQLGSRLYVFAQARVDRGFDPGPGALEGRMDEYALRFTPRSDGIVNLQVGKFGTVVGNWVARHHSWEDPFITAPLPYENLTGIFDSAAANSAATLFRWAHVGPSAGAGGDYYYEYRVPVLWGPSYASGAALTGIIGRADYAVEVKNASLSSRPSNWDAGQTQWQQPTFSGRLGYRPDESWELGLSASTGTYLSPAARPTLAPGRKLADYREVVWGQDLGFAWHHFQFWAEVYEASFAIPGVGQADTTAYYLEANYKFTPQFSGAVRWNQQLFGHVADSTGRPVRWGQNVWRVDVAPNYRFTSHTEVKLQYSLQSDDTSPHRVTQLVAGQFVLRF